MGSLPSRTSRVPEAVKKEGTGKPQNPDISLDVDVRARELYFEEVPETEVRFRGNTKRNSVWRSKRENLPHEVQEGIVYRNARVRLQIASEIVNSDPDFQNSSYKERVDTNTEDSEQKTGEQESESR